MSTFTVALLQINSRGTDVAANQSVGASACRRAAAMGADLALFPEMWSIGYTDCPQDAADAARWRDLAVPANGEFVASYQALAKELGIAIAITYLEAHEPAPRNSMSLIDRHGEVVLQYSKVHTCGFGMEAALTPGTSFEVATLSTASGDIKVGAMICYDRHFPESARMLMLKGAEIVLVPNACELEINRLSQLRSRAFENLVGIAMTNYPAPYINGHSIAFDGMAFSEGSRDMTLVEAGENEGIYLAAFNIDALRDYRRIETWDDAYRKPMAYEGLVDGSVHNTFARPDWRRSQ